MGVKSDVLITVPLGRYRELYDRFVVHGNEDEQALMRWSSGLYKVTCEGRDWVGISWNDIKWYDEDFAEIISLMEWLRGGTYRFLELIEGEDEVERCSNDFPHYMRLMGYITKSLDIDADKTSNEELGIKEKEEKDGGEG